MNIIKKILAALGIFTITSAFILYGFAKIYIAERQQCMLTYKNDFAQFYNRYACNENHEYSLQQKGVLRHAVTVQ
jgi:hypothetical protein